MRRQNEEKANYKRKNKKLCHAGLAAWFQLVICEGGKFISF